MTCPLPMLRLALAPLVLFAAACGGGGGGSGGGGATPFPVPATVPPGSGQLTIQMAGTWKIRDAVIVDTNSPSPATPANGTTIAFDGKGIVSIAGLSVARTDLEALLGTTLTFYFNEANGKTVLYGLGTDRFAVGGTRDQIGVAGGSLDDNTIAVESFTSTQQDAASPVIFVRARYFLARTDTAIAPATALTDSDQTPAAERLRAAIRAMVGGG